MSPSRSTENFNYARTDTALFLPAGHFFLLFFIFFLLQLFLLRPRFYLRVYIPWWVGTFFFVYFYSTVWMLGRESLAQRKLVQYLNTFACCILDDWHSRTQFLHFHIFFIVPSVCVRSSTKCISRSDVRRVLWSRKKRMKKMYVGREREEEDRGNSGTTS